MTADQFVLMTHAPGADELGSVGGCIPRISLDCAACGQSVIFCHLAAETIDAYVDPEQPPWRCADCSDCADCGGEP